MKEVLQEEWDRITIEEINKEISRLPTVMARCIAVMYAALGTRSDIAYAVAALSRYNSRPLAVNTSHDNETDHSVSQGG
jgi:stage III sporulation protein SpoIIIAA